MSTNRKTQFIGRKEELRELGAALRGTEGDARLLVVHGEPGMGKTALLDAALQPALRERTLVVRIGLADCAEPVLDTVADRLCDLLTAQGDNAALALVAAVRRAQAGAARDRRHSLHLLLEARAAVRHIAAHRPPAVVVDDAHLVPEAEVGALGALLRAIRSDGVPVVVCGRTERGAPGVVHALATAADRVLELPPLTWAQTSALAGRRLGLPAAPELVSALRRALGPLAGNPRAVLSAVGTLWERDRLLLVDGSACLSGPDTPVQLPIGRAEVHRIWRIAGGPDFADEAFLEETLALLTRLTEAARTTVDDFLDLAPELGGSVAHLGRVLDTLVEHRLITVDDKQSLKCAVPGLGADLRTVRTRRQLARLHARVVTNARRRLGTRSGTPDPRLCDHALAAGAELPVALSNEILLAAVRRGGAGVERRRAARAALALTRQLASDDESLPGVLRTTIALMLDHGDAGGLLELGGRFLPAGTPCPPRSREFLPDLASAWALAALHEQWLGTRVVDHDSPAARTAVRFPSAAALMAMAAHTRGEAPRGKPVDAPAHAPLCGFHLPGRLLPDAPRERPEPEPSEGLDDSGGPAGPYGPGEPGEPREPEGRGSPDGPGGGREPDRTGGPGTRRPSEAPAHLPLSFSRDTDLPVGLVPAAAETRLVTGTLGTRAEFDAALAAVRGLRSSNGLTPLDDTERLREAASLGDWASAFETVLGDRCAQFEDSPLRTYQSLVREYLTGSWEVALALARRIEMHAEGAGRGPLYDHSRGLASEICRWQGDTDRAAAWLSGVEAPRGWGPLPSWARTGLRHVAGDPLGAWRDGWRDYRILRATGHLAGLERLLLRLLGYAVVQGHDRAVRESLEALEELHASVDSQATRVTTLLARAVAHDDVNSALAAYGLLARHGDQSLSFIACLWLARTTGTEKWLAEAWEWSERLGARRARQSLADVAHGLGHPLPRRRATRSVFSRLEVEVVGMVADGWTNRQIAAVLARSEKSVETYLARIFERTGCRSRLELATAWLDGGLARFVPG
ncbi:AAA family ATPase [Streptomyces sp. NPDC096310]|uniref:helix-turn-helix transcriptional regulator n=1 Tax=Streptomyces sp. NPDC096310 TaxID=3366082 RepID=UPI003811F0DA